MKRERQADEEREGQADEEREKRMIREKRGIVERKTNEEINENSE